MAGRLFGSRRDGYDCGHGREEAWQVSRERLPRNFWLEFQNDEAERLGALARTTIECIARSDALYHTYEHTMLVSMVGRDILRGRTLAHTVQPEDYIHLIVACLLHDIGFVRGVLSGDTKTEFVIDKNGRTVTLPRGASDASLAAYHVDRSKLFVYERLGKSTTIDPARVAAAIELTRFPPSPNSESDQIELEPRLVQAADLIGQLGDPLYPRKANALFYEFEELGSNRQYGYSSPADLVEKFPAFYWNTVSAHLEEGMKYLSLTASGRQWIANLHNHIFNAEHFNWQMGPQIPVLQTTGHATLARNCVSMAPVVAALGERGGRGQRPRLQVR